MSIKKSKSALPNTIVMARRMPRPLNHGRSHNQRLEALKYSAEPQKWLSRVTDFKLRGNLLAKVAGQGKVYPSAGGCGLKSNRYNLSIGLKKATLSSAVEIAE